MHDKRNFALVLLAAAGLVWAIVAWRFLEPPAPMLLVQRTASILLATCCAGWLFWSLRFEDRLPDHLRAITGLSYETDGLCFMPIIRMHRGRPELCVYYQNRYENAVYAVIHLRPVGDGFVIHDGWRDVHFAFQAGGGDFGIIHQPIRVPRHLSGEVIEMDLAAASHYPRSHGAELRRTPGMPCGTLLVDWTGAAFKTGVHEVSGEINLIRPTRLHLSLPYEAPESQDAAVTEQPWRQERLAVG